MHPMHPLATPMPTSTDYKQCCHRCPLARFEVGLLQSPQAAEVV